MVFTKKKKKIIHVDVRQTSNQYCKAIILQLKIISFRKRIAIGKKKLTSKGKKEFKKEKRKETRIPSRDYTWSTTSKIFMIWPCIVKAS